MTEECQARWEATEEQIKSIIIPAMKNIAQLLCFGLRVAVN